MKKKTEQNAAGAPQMGKTAGAGAAGFLKKNWKENEHVEQSAN